MSDTNKKRSRKAKLVPRTFMEFDENGASQEQQSSIKIIDVKSIKEEPQDTASGSGPMTIEIPFDFAVNLQVEEYEDEGRLQIDESAYQEEEDAMVIKTEAVDLDEEKDVYQPIEIHNVKQERVTPDRDDVSDAQEIASLKSIQESNINEYSVAKEDILYVAEKLMTSDNLADRILAAEARNIIGRLKELPLEPNELDQKIQRVLEDNWTDSLRSLPLFYKCYICTKSWWHFAPFRDHLKSHNSTIEVSVEEICTDECNLIAYTGDVPWKADVYTQGSCWRCGKDYSIHKLSARDSYHFYTCKKCFVQFPSCTMLKDHENNSTKCYKVNGSLSCTLCDSTFSVSIDKQMHMILKHTVRSDLLIQTPYKQCSYCNEKYFIQNLHECKVRLKNSLCNFCFRKFTNKLMCDLHMSIANVKFECRICGLVLAKRCMEYEHVLMHSTSFIFPDKCISCEDFTVYLSPLSAVQHGYIKHNLKCDRRKNYFDKVLVPIICIYPNYENPSTADVPPEHYLVNGLPMAPVARIKVELMDEETPQNAVTAKTEPLTIKVEPSLKEEPTIKEELSDEDYEDDIIRLDYKTDTKTPKFYSCTKCGYRDVHKLYIKHKKFGCGKLYDNTTYVCSKCEAAYVSLKVYLKHFVVHGMQYRSCPECKEVYPNFSTLMPHFNSHVKRNYIRVNSIYHLNRNSPASGLCKKCTVEVKFEDRFTHWESHLFEPKTDRTLNRTESENEEAELEINLNRDGVPEGLKPDVREMLIDTLMDTEKKKIRDCPLCSHHFNRNNECKRHIVEHLLSDANANSIKYGALKCQICGEKYKKPDRYKRHMRDHGLLPIFQCELCDKTFSDSSNFTKHKKLHNLKVLVCDLCSKKFQTKTSLVKHLELHRTLEPVTCTICLKSFYCQTMLRKHTRTVHEKANIRFRCVICQAKFITSKEKWDHLWLVHNERKCKADCYICGARFRKMSDLKKHLSIHNKKAEKDNLNKMCQKKNEIQQSLVLPPSERETLVVIYDEDDDE